MGYSKSDGVSRLVCDVCPQDDSRGCMATGTTAAILRQSAKLKGWRKDKLGRDICPKHPKLKGAKV
jgi:hypothetical protein